MAKRHRRSARQRGRARRPHDERAEEHARPLRIAALPAGRPPVRAGCPRRSGQPSPGEPRERLSRGHEPPRARDGDLRDHRERAVRRREQLARPGQLHRHRLSVSAVLHRRGEGRHRPLLRDRHDLARSRLLHLAAGAARRQDHRRRRRQAQSRMVPGRGRVGAARRRRRPRRDLPVVGAAVEVPHAQAAAGADRDVDPRDAPVRALSGDAAAAARRARARARRADRADGRRAPRAALSRDAPPARRARLAARHARADRAGRRRRAQRDDRHRVRLRVAQPARVLLAHAPRAREGDAAQPRAAAKRVCGAEPACRGAHGGSVAGERAAQEGSRRAHPRGAGTARRARRARPGEQARRARPDGGRHHARAEPAARRAAQLLRQHPRAARPRRAGGRAREPGGDRRAHRADGQDHESAQAVRRACEAAQRAGARRARCATCSRCSRNG